MLPTNPKQIIIVDDHPAIIKGLTFAFESEWPECAITSFQLGSKAVEAYPSLNPDIVLLDYQMPDQSGYITAMKLLKIEPTAKILLFTFLDSLPIAGNFLAIGGRGFVTKDADLDTLFAAITTIIQGDYYFHSRHERELSKMLHHGISNKFPKIQFSTRELEVCLKLSRGLSVKMIAHELDLSVRTVESYKESMIVKTGVKSTIELIDFIYQNGIKQI